MSLESDSAVAKQYNERNERPLISFCLFTYNQRGFIREAVKAALAQTYSPLEIILSDDASTDGTPEIMMEMARSYQGPHKVIVNRETKNRGLIGHVNSVVRQARGELLVGAAGDDVSLPERVEMCYQAWADSGWRSGSIWSDYTVIDQDGKPLGRGFSSGPTQRDRMFEHLRVRPDEVAAWKAPTVFGCTHAWSPKVFQTFGDLPSIKDFVIEDISIYFRSALLMGQITRIHKPLVLYRRHDANCSAAVAINGVESQAAQKPDGARQERLFRRMMAVCKCFRRDIHAFNKTRTDVRHDRELSREVARSYRFFQLRARVVRGRGRGSLSILFRILRLDRGRKQAFMEIVAGFGRTLGYDHNKER